MPGFYHIQWQGVYDQLRHFKRLLEQHQNDDYLIKNVNELKSMVTGRILKSNTLSTDFSPEYSVTECQDLIKSHFNSKSLTKLMVLDDRFDGLIVELVQTVGSIQQVQCDDSLLLQLIESTGLQLQSKLNRLQIVVNDQKVSHGIFQLIPNLQDLSIIFRVLDQVNVQDCLKYFQRNSNLESLEIVLHNELKMDLQSVHLPSRLLESIQYLTDLKNLTIDIPFVNKQTSFQIISIVEKIPLKQLQLNDINLHLGFGIQLLKQTSIEKLSIMVTSNTIQELLIILRKSIHLHSIHLNFKDCKDVHSNTIQSIFQFIGQNIFIKQFNYEHLSIPIPKSLIYENHPALVMNNARLKNLSQLESLNSFIFQLLNQRSLILLSYQLNIDILIYILQLQFHHFESYKDPICLSLLDRQCIGKFTNHQSQNPFSYQQFIQTCVYYHKNSIN
ncbi:hypothetical protein BC833DRAFT_597488 [Globomyces pollinis-pini]|nr:hypothetical protein BC833DRAFT_597488 [Globomyces pollinis-pini]